MEKQEIIRLLTSSHGHLLAWFTEFGDKYWEYGPQGKWTTGQHIIHLVQGFQPLNKAMKIPKLALKMKFGKSNRKCRNYEQIKEKYLQKLNENRSMVSPFSKNMPDSILNEMDDWLRKFTVENDKLLITIQEKWSEKDLDMYVLRHPLMGKMPVREMLIWMAYHTEHHLNLIIERAEMS
jgi:hypothetical protein